MRGILDMDSDSELEHVGLIGDVWKYPDELGRFKPGLLIGEQYGVSKWWEVLSPKDRFGLLPFLNSFYDFLCKSMDERNDELGQYSFFRYENYCALFAIGSTARHEKEYGDIDFLLVTDMIYRDMGLIELEYFFEEDEEYAMSTVFQYGIDPTLDEAYKNSRGGASAEERSVIELNPRNSYGGLDKKIHLTLQPEVESVEDWQEIDEEALVLVYRTDKGENDLVLV